jgi:hypothetical protein
MNDKWCMVFIVFLGVALAVSACTPDNRVADLQRCIGAAASKAGSATLTGEEAHDAVGAGAADCMKLLGYRHDMAGPKCVDDVDFNSFCYVRRRRD